MLMLLDIVMSIACFVHFKSFKAVTGASDSALAFCLGANCELLEDVMFV